MKPIQIEAAGTTFYYDRMDAFEALEVFGDLQKDVLPSIGGLLSAMGSIKGEEDADDEAVDKASDAVAAAVAQLSANFTGKQLKYWSDRLLSRDRVSVEIEGEARRLGPNERRLAFDSFTDILELLFHVLRIEFAEPLFTYANQFGLDLRFPQANRSDATATR